VAGVVRAAAARRALTGHSRVRRCRSRRVRNRVVQDAVKIVLKPVFEAQFVPCSFGFRP
jgi:RNA-directed DNA polymerase